MPHSEGTFPPSDRSVELAAQGDDLQADSLAVAETDESRYRLLVEAVTDYAIYMIDTNGLVTSWNSGARRFKGYESGEIIGEHRSWGAPRHTGYMIWRAIQDGSAWESIMIRRRSQWKPSGAGGMRWDRRSTLGRRGY